MLRDDKGKRTGTVEPGIGGDLIARDAEGRRSKLVEPRNDGWVVRDRQGRRIGTVEKR